MSPKKSWCSPCPALAAILIALAGGNAESAITLPDLIADHMVVQRDREIPVWGTAAPGSEIIVEFAGQSVAAKAGAAGDWAVKLSPRPAGGPFEMRIRGDGERTVKDILIGDVWLSSGQSNLTFRMVPNPPWSEGVLDYEKEIAAATNPKLRFFSVLVSASHVPESEAFGTWAVSTPENVRFVSAVSYYFGRDVQERAGIPIGIIVSGRGGTSIKSWMDRASLQRFPDTAEKIAAEDKKIAAAPDLIAAFRAKLPAYREACRKALATNGKVPSFPEPYPNYDTKPSHLYHAMIAPLARVPVRGFLWYQGESDSQIADQYPELFKALITSRRAEWNAPDAPFLFVQIANYDPVKARNLDPARYGGTWARQRAAQATALALPNTAMAVSADVGDTIKVHPRDKKTVGNRLARAALGLVYGEKIPFRGPRPESASASGPSVKVGFSSDGGNLKPAAELTGFELAGPDGAFHEATGTQEGNTVILTAAGVSEPVRVRYAWKDDPRLSVYDEAGLPLPPFEQLVGSAAGR